MVPPPTVDRRIPRKSSGLNEASVPGDVAVPTEDYIVKRFESDSPVRPVHRWTGGIVSKECQRFVTWMSRSSIRQCARYRYVGQ
jgi:hypothetical protein